MTDLNAPKEASKPQVPPPLKKIPGFSQGVRANAAMRRLVMNSPVCPYSQHEYTKDAFGRMVPKDRIETNCQLAGGKWWIDCEERGHNPYFTERIRYTMEDVYETDSQGREIKVGEQKITHRVTIPNTVSVPVNRRLNNGRGVIDSMEKKGRRRLKDAGYEEVCQFRNCQNPVNPKFHSVPYGDYCSKEHFNLSVANESGTLLPHLNSKLNQGSEEQLSQKRDRMLREVAWAAVEER